MFTVVCVCVSVCVRVRACVRACVCAPHVFSLQKSRVLFGTEKLVLPLFISTKDRFLEHFIIMQTVQNKSPSIDQQSPKQKINQSDISQLYNSTSTIS